MSRKFQSYVPLHGHSSYSLSDGVSKIDEIFKRAKELGFTAISLTEHGNMSSFYKFYNAAKGTGIKPIMGCEFYLNDAYHKDPEAFKNSRRKNKIITLDEDISDSEVVTSNGYENCHMLSYAKNYEGLNNIIHLSNIGFSNFYGKPLISSEQVFENLDHNNIVTTTCLSSNFNKLILQRKFKEATYLLSQYKEKFGEDFYIEMHINELDEQTLVNRYYERIAPKLGIKLSIALDYHYVNKSDWEIQYLLYAIKSRKTVREMPVEDWFYQLHDLYIKSTTELYDKAQSLGYSDDIINHAIETTFEIASKVEVEIPTYQNKFPEFTNSLIESEKIFDDKINLKWEEKLTNGLIPLDKLTVYQDRLSYEISIIKSKKFVDYFLILDDLLNNFVYKSGGASGAGRGSAGGSLVLFVLDITKIDPIKHELIFERFLNPARTDPADVDCDIDHITQKKVEDYLIQRWGKDKVCHISSFGKFGTKTVVKDLCRIYELDYNLSNQLTLLFNTLKSENDVENELSEARKIAEKQNNRNLINFIDENSALLIEKGSKMVGMVRNLGRHASGILISNKSFDKSDLPISILKGDAVTGVQEGGDEREVSELGFLKLDILGLIAATVNAQAIKAVEEKYNIKKLENQILLSDFDDKAVYEEFTKGNCKDIFQFGSDNMISLIKRIKPNSLADLSAINALFRPALIQSGGVESYCKNRENPKKAKKEADKIHPDLWPILKDTFGIPLFQESIMFVLQKIGGFSLAEADKARKTLKLLHKGNQDKTDDFIKMIEKFKVQAIKNGINPENADSLLSTLASYTEYSFNKSHSCAYAMNAYVSQYLKVHYPKEYYCALLNNSTSEDTSTYIKQAAASGIDFGGCCYGECANNFEVDYEKNIIKFGLSSVKGVRLVDIEQINSFNTDSGKELIRFIINNKINKKAIETLSRLGFFKKIIHKNYCFVEQLIFKLKTSKIQYFDDDYDEYFKYSNRFEDYSAGEKSKIEKECLGFYFNEHPFTVYFNKLLDKKISDNYVTPKSLLDKYKDYKGNLNLMGLVSEIKMLKGKKSGKEYYKIILEDDEQQVNITIFETEAINKLKIGDIINIGVKIDEFGASKIRKQIIRTLESSSLSLDKDKLKSFDEITFTNNTDSWF